MSRSSPSVAIISVRADTPDIRRVSALPQHALSDLLQAHGLSLAVVPPGEIIPHSYWGETEAGVRGLEIYARDDTPVHSVLHTLAHVICMDSGRRSVLERDCGSDDVEEEAVCYLQAQLADELPGYSGPLLFADMDAWGYHFRLGSARAWFEQDAQRAQAWLEAQGLLRQGRPGYVLRGA